MKQKPVTKHPLWNKWRYMQQCLSDWDIPDAYRAKKRGLQCDWSNFRDFADDVEAKLGLPKRGEELVRKNFLKGWHLNNLTYAKPKIKGSRLTHAYRLKYKGKTYCAKHLAAKTGKCYWTVLRRIRNGWSVKDAVEK